MFTTFVGTPQSNSNTAVSVGSISSTSSASTPTTNTAPVRPKRSQVARACDWCRVHRIKCDSDQPCYNCRSRGGQCSNKGATEVRTLPHAFREIERLRNRVQELEREIENRDRAIRDEAAANVYPSPRSSGTPTGTAGPTSCPRPSPSDLNPWSESGRRPKYLDGIYMSTAQSHQKQWFGPSSLFYFISRLHGYLAVAFQQPYLEHSSHFQSATKPFNNPIVPDRNQPVLDPQITSRRFLTATQEEYFLGLFWQSYHCSLQIIDEVQFKEHYRSLWTPDGKTRKPSALVDIILALCMQQGIPVLPRGGGHAIGMDKSTCDMDGNDPATADIDARWHYQRCQTLLNAELECPTLSTLQCQIFSVIYLCCSSFQNMAHSTLAIAVRTAHILGLHLEPPADMSRPERELRKRLWWTLYTVESKTCMKLGRPWSATLSETTCTLPADDHQLAIQSGSSVSCGGNVTWLTYTVQNTKLVLAARSVHIAFYQKCSNVLDASNAKTLYEDLAALENCAHYLQSSMECLEVWLRNVPEALKNKRKEGGEPLSIDRSGLAIEIFAPLWLQRQRLFLELLYHNISMNLYRPFICFPPSPSTPVTEGCANACVDHAIALTHIIHQVLSETDLLNGWHEAFQWQWNAALTMIGFTLAYPLSLTTTSANAGIALAIQVFGMFGRDFAVSFSAANVTQDLLNKVEFLSRYRTCPADSMAAPPADQVLRGLVGTQTHMVPHHQQHPLQLQQDEEIPAEIQEMLAGTMDLAFLVDGSFDNNLEFLYPNNVNMADLWMTT
ncbi:fungal-specific transcription factor domain-containing protein [Bombardia bombarda]|uniref:Fungal-specific transcription factor domain-containing protein n=1 Tax=Bombardia bombarda TaxID=252184 RepID=A0AA39WGD1_9PEZI|nr:fungal-specific transcription factor domain-containing protein [Bombardia bombarda]